MYTQYFNLTARPFSISPDPAFLYKSIWHQEGLAHLQYGIEVGGGFVVLTGEVGTGKTLLCQCLIQQLPASVDLAFILNPRLDALELLASICDELAISYLPERNSLKYFVDLLNKHLLNAHANGRKTVVMIDEAQNLSLEVLEQIRLLTNLETSQEKLLQIILVGQPELQELLKSPALRQLNQRITARYHLQALDLSETGRYIQFRLSHCGGNSTLFKAAAIKKIYQYSKGIPRLINKLCDRALLGAYTLGVKKITPRMIEQAAHEMLMTTNEFKIKPYPLLTGLLIGALLVFGLSQHNGIDLKQKIFPFEPEKPIVTKTTGINELFEQTGHTFSEALVDALHYTHTPIPENAIPDCNNLVSHGIQCFLDKGHLKDILTLNRPTILELENSLKQKKFVVLTALRGKNAVLYANAEQEVTLLELLRYWNGYFLVLWQPPELSPPTILPYQKAPFVSWLRTHLTPEDLRVDNRDFFDKALVEKITLFQQQHDVIADGILGARTFIILQNKFQAAQYPQLTISD